eukprot:scaffold175027_cov37-Tisochrysis_lutea.AAC.5
MHPLMWSASGAIYFAEISYTNHQSEDRVVYEYGPRPIHTFTRLQGASKKYASADAASRTWPEPTDSEGEAACLHP